VVRFVVRKRLHTAFVALGVVTRGDFGTSFRHQRPALPLVMGRLPATFELASAARGGRRRFPASRS
jgi:ABC-type dipeptide/oligopeptide/nickel transport system permease component